MKQRLTFVALSVSDLASSLRFYRDVLGLPLHDESHDSDLRDRWYGGPHAAYSWTDGAYLHFALYPSQPPHRPVSIAAQIGFHMSDFDVVHALAANGGCTSAEDCLRRGRGDTSRASTQWIRHTGHAPTRAEHSRIVQSGRTIAGNDGYLYAARLAILARALEHSPAVGRTSCDARRERNGVAAPRASRIEYGPTAFRGVEGR